jgi:hypothetical protein
MTIPPLIDFPLLTAFYVRQDTLLAGQRETHALLTTLITEIRTMASDLDRANAALASIAQNQQDEATEIAAISAEISALVAQQPALADLANRLEAVATSSQTNAAALAAIAPAPAPDAPPAA